MRMDDDVFVLEFFPQFRYRFSNVYHQHFDTREQTQRTQPGDFRNIKQTERAVERN